ncbi:MAG: hypothetical protein O7J95_13795, partial [Planctomycetota bacterium]|nr:hypothetical protein [Planctomycetota bacterium]
MKSMDERIVLHRSTVPQARCRRVVLWTLSCLLVGLPGSRGQDNPPPGSEKGRRLAGEQEDIKEDVVEIERRLGKLATELEGSEPDEAERLRKAAQKIQISRLPATLEQIQGFLRDHAFHEALAREETAIQLLREVVQLLEDQPFESSNVDKVVGKLKARRLAVRKLIGRQSSLLEKLQSFLERLKDAAALGALRSALEHLTAEQERLRDGEDPEAIDPAGFREDQEKLQRALELAKRLQADQERVNRGLSQLPDPDAGLREGREALEALGDLIERARSLLERTEALEMARQALSRSSADDSPRESPAGRRPSGANDPADDPADIDSRGPAETPAGGKSADGKSADGKSADGKSA